MLINVEQLVNVLKYHSKVTPNVIYSEKIVSMNLMINMIFIQLWLLLLLLHATIMKHQMKLLLLAMKIQTYFDKWLILKLYGLQLNQLVLSQNAKSKPKDAPAHMMEQIFLWMEFSSLVSKMKRMDGMKKFA